MDQPSQSPSLDPSEPTEPRRFKAKINYGEHATPQGFECEATSIELIVTDVAGDEHTFTLKEVDSETFVGMKMFELNYLDHDGGGIGLESIVTAWGEDHVRKGD